MPVPRAVRVGAKDLTASFLRALTTVARLRRAPAAWIMLALTVVSVLQRPGRITFDTKLDLVVDPAAFLGRALSLWNPQATAGELQNQAYGYLFPMGPYFLLSQAVGLPTWLAQRLWCALLLCVAFGGVLLLARALRIGTGPARYVGALAYALAPRMLTEIGPLSAEMLPVVLLPWVLLPLVTAARLDSPRRAAGLSALAVLCMGGINGAMVVMALVLPVLWLLTRRWNRDQVRLVLWWCSSVLMAVLWWVLPLLLLGRYSLPFLDYIESASNTTAPMSLFEALRGTNQWVAYVVGDSPWWPSGWLLIDNPVLMVATGLVAGLGLVGLVRPGLRERRFLVLGTISGLALLSMGYVGTLDSPLAEPVRYLLDGPLAPLRNVHKFEPVLRLPLMLAFTHAVSGRLPRFRVAGAPAWTRVARVATGLALVMVMAAPAWLLTLRPGPGWTQLPEYWRTAMNWLGDADRDARTLLLPATGFAEYTWGRTLDEPAQPLARAPWAVRNQTPLGSEGNTRLMDAVDQALANGRGSPGLAGFLARSGYRFLLLRNDIDRASTGAPPLAVLRAGLAGSPGITRVADFGPEVTPADPRVVDTSASRVPAVEIFEVRGPVPRVRAVNADDVATVSGGPEALLPLLDSGLLEPDRPTVLAGDGGATGSGPRMITDGLRRGERNFGRVRDNLSQTLTESEPGRLGRRSLDLVPFPGVEHQTTAVYRGIRTVTASSSRAFADAAGESDPSWLPFAALDGDLSTSWHSSGYGGPIGQWLEVELDSPRPVDEVALALGDDLRIGWQVTRIRITTDTGSVEHAVSPGSTLRSYPTARGLTGRVRVTVLSVVADRQDGNVAIAELSIPGISAGRALRVPGDQAKDGAAPAFSFSQGAQHRFSCYPSDAGPRCDARLARAGEEPQGPQRLFRTSALTRYQLEATVLPARNGRFPVSPSGVEVSGYSQLAGDPTASPLAAVDGDPTSTWIADVTDPRPVLSLKWPSARTITGLRVVTSAGSAAARPSELLVSTPRGSRAVRPDPEGRAEFPALETDQLTIEVVRSEPAGQRGNPPGISELTLTGTADLLLPFAAEATFQVPCGAGPAITVDGIRYQTGVSGTMADFMAHRPMRLSPCAELAAGVELNSGKHELRTESSASFVVQDLWMRPIDSVTAPVRHRETRVQQWDTTHREIGVGAGDTALIVVPENSNAGWQASWNGTPLQRTRVDGWQQAWVLPSGAEGLVRLDFTPNASYRTGLVVGAVAAAGLPVLLMVPVRRRRPVQVSPSSARWIPVTLAVFLALLGGILPIVALLGCLVLRRWWPRISTALTVGGCALAGAVAVTGRLLGMGQEWAHGVLAQGALLVVLAAVVTACIPWFTAPSPAPDDQRG